MKQWEAGTNEKQAQMKQWTVNTKNDKHKRNNERQTFMKTNTLTNIMKSKYKKECKWWKKDDECKR